MSYVPDTASPPAGGRGRPPSHIGGRVRGAVFLFALASVFAPAICHADVIIPLIILEMPSMIVLLLPVILIETLIFLHHVPGTDAQVFRAVGKANVISTLVGLPLACVANLILGALTLVGFPVEKDLSHSTHTIVEALSFGSALMVREGIPRWAVPTAVLASLVPAFFLSVWIEFRVLRRHYHDQEKIALKQLIEETTLKRLTYRANLASYAFLALVAAVLLGLSLKPL